MTDRRTAAVSRASPGSPPRPGGHHPTCFEDSTPMSLLRTPGESVSLVQASRFLRGGADATS